MNRLVRAASILLNIPIRPFRIVTRSRVARAIYYLRARRYDILVDRIRRLLLADHPEGLRKPDLSFANYDPARPPAFSRHAAPMVSVIVPVYNQIDYTLRCLQSLATLRDASSFEVIVVDDNSSDDTPARLAGIVNAVILHNPVNEGFIRSCNRGAGAARGRFLVFLNNDTIVLPGWLDELVNTAFAHDGPTLIGSKLIYPNGALQEAGCIIWRDGSAWNYGRGDHPDRPEYCYLRDVDYCSGASVLIDRATFDRLGGFDEHYLPAYGEDADLAFKLRSAGGRVVYQPMSKLVHFEGMTSGRSTEHGVKRYQVVNAEKLARRWREELAHHEPHGSNAIIARDRGVKGRIFVVDACTPTPDQDAGSLKIFNYMKIFQAQGYKVVFAADNLTYIDGYTPALQRIGIECLYWPFTRSIRHHLSKHGRHYDFILSCRPDITQIHLGAFRKYCPQARVLFDTGDLHFIREMRRAELDGNDKLAVAAQSRKRQELKLAAAVDCTIVVSQAERDILLGENPALNVSVISAVHESYPRGPGFAERSGLLFIGGYQHEPNVDAALHLVNDILPGLRARIPGIQCYLVGSRPPLEVQALAGQDVVVAGYVPDLTGLMGQCRISVNPLRYGAGIKGKLVTSMAYGLPIVGTSIACEGMNLRDGEEVLIADGCEAFCDAVARLYLDEFLWTRLSDNGYLVLRRDYSFDTATRRFSDLFATLRPAHSTKIRP